MADWDPIGVRDWPEAADEYDSYLGDILVLLERRSTAFEIEEYLLSVETERMGLTGVDGEPLRSHPLRLAAAEELQRTFNSQMLID